MTTEALKQAREALVDILPYVKDIGRFAKVDPAIAALDAAIAQEAADREDAERWRWCIDSKNASKALPL